MLNVVHSALAAIAAIAAIAALTTTLAAIWSIDTPCLRVRGAWPIVLQLRRR